MASVIVIVTLASSSARADTTHDCVEAANSGQSLRDTGKLVAARNAFMHCSVEVCPAVVRESCQRWGGEVETRLPTITLGAKNDAGEDLSDVRVSIDSIVVTSKLDGRAIAIDPGPHDLIFHADGFADAHQSIIVREGEKARPIVATLSKSADASAPGISSEDPKPKRNLVPLLITGAVTVVGASGFAIFGAWGQSEKNHLSDTCGPSETCASADVSAARTKLIVADISLAVGVVGAGFFTAFLIAPLFSSDAKTKSSASLPSVGVAPARSGAFGTLEWRY